jgi:hypothetical protein
MQMIRPTQTTLLGPPWPQDILVLRVLLDVVRWVPNLLDSFFYSKLFVEFGYSVTNSFTLVYIEHPDMAFCWWN